MSSSARKLLGCRIHVVVALLGAAILFESPSTGAAADSQAEPVVGTPFASAIGFYQRHLSSLRGMHCPFDPSCSQYALEVVHDRGVMVGVALACDRLMRCNPSARRFYARGSDHRLVDPVKGLAPARHPPRVPQWLLPPMDVEPPAGQSQQSLEYAAFATALARDGECERAGTEYRRAAYVAGTPGMAAWALFRSGACYYAMEHWDAAADEFLRARAKAVTTEEQRAARQLLSTCRFNEGDFDAGAVALTEIDSTSDDRGSSFALIGLCDMARGRWTSARSRFASALASPAGSQHPSKFNYLIAATEKGEFLPRRSPGLATALSAIVPGTGQMYCGRMQDGIRHLIINGALIYTIVELALGEHYGAAYVVAGIEVPFYLGNILGARRAARDFDRTARLSFVASALAHTEN